MRYLTLLAFLVIVLGSTSQNVQGMDGDTPKFQPLKTRFPRTQFIASNPQDDPTIETCVESVFLGPHAENAKILEEFIVEVLRDHIYWRRNFHPSDPCHITEKIKSSPEYLDSHSHIQGQLRLLLADLKKSLPTSSIRYQGHINWEVSIPSMLGYFAAMLYNPNNVAFEGAPITSYMEEKVARDFCKLIGYSVISREKEEILPWGQLTAGGTTANIQALWTARNLKFFPLAIRWALLEEPLCRAQDIIVKLPNQKTGKLVDLEAWTLLNLESDEVLSLPEKILELINGQKNVSAAHQMSLKEVYEHLVKYSLQKRGIFYVYNRIAAERKEHHKVISSPVVLVPGTRHYSFPKAVSLLGLGEDSLENIGLDVNARLDTKLLKAALLQCAENGRPIVSVLGVVGSTEESSVDPVEKIVALRREFNAVNIDFSIHVDAAFGGYHASCLTPDKHYKEVPTVPLSGYVTAQFESLKNCDSVTIDPHKSGYIPYPAGGICYRDDRIKNMVHFSAPVLATREDEEPTVGIFGIEGSRPGAAAAAVYLSHRAIPLTMKGHGKLLGQALYSTKEFFLRLLETKDKNFIVVPLAPLPTVTNTREEYVKEKKALIKSISLPNFRERQNKQNQEDFYKKLSGIGPDLNMLVYAFNFCTETGVLNSNLERANMLNTLIYNKLRPRPHTPATEYKLILSNTSLEKSMYGPQCLENYMNRLGITQPSETDKPYSINVLRSVVMNPWVTETEKGSMLDVIIKELTDTCKSVLESPEWKGLESKL